MLYIVPTPIGNLGDITARSLEALKSVRAVYCEDTRRTRKLMSHFGISTPLIRYQDRDDRAIDRILARLAGGDDLALTSDAGMPVISDPGLRLISRARAEGHRVTALPGPCAIAPAVAGSGLPGDSFVFLGFLPRSPSKRRRALEAVSGLGKSVVVYESPYRVNALFEAAEAVFGPQARAAACRELSKIHEEWITGSVSSVRSVLASRKEILGEFVVVLHPGK